jgi:cytochrome b involved in lipid metabolism
MIISLVCHLILWCFAFQHPGGPKPLKFNSGKDATEAFEKVKHSDDAREWKEKFLIGKMEEKVVLNKSACNNIF